MQAIPDIPLESRYFIDSTTDVAFNILLVLAAMPGAELTSFSIAILVLFLLFSCKKNLIGGLKSGFIRNIYFCLSWENQTGVLCVLCWMKKVSIIVRNYNLYNSPQTVQFVIQIVGTSNKSWKSDSQISWRLSISQQCGSTQLCIF